MLGFVYSANLKEPGFKAMLNKRGKLYAESSKFFIPLGKKE